ncbi:hypothetical protein [Streptomyces scabiei]|uniref:hypothetical protein n=1 Tax=Streptomyces scabiei TaxID=1930 RepID=UPI0029BB6EC7|nr:hypothetical protein [Streptomyces scabiei]MDX3142261.1 hypothetical protein [Streptomyces scabiei]
MTSNPELAAALATVPEIERTEKLLDEAKARLRDHPPGSVPDVARNDVINTVVAGFQADGSWPSDVGKRASKAYMAALEWEAERTARKSAVESTELLAYDTRQAYSADALEHLGARLAEVLSDAREAAETLGDVGSAGAAIKAGEAATAAWGRLQSLVTDLANIRAAQWALLDPGPRPRSIVGDDDTDERRQLREWKRQGYGEVRGARADAASTEEYLLWLARVGTAYVPASFGDLEADVVAATEPTAYDDITERVVDYSPRVTRELEYKQPNSGRDPRPFTD